MIIWLGFDPGGRDTGGVLRCGSTLLAYVVKTSTAGVNKLPTREYVNDVIAWGREETAHHESLGHQVRVAIENLTVPTGYKHGERAWTPPATIMGVAMVFMGLAVAFPDAVIVPTGRHGQHPLPLYPKVLVGPRTTKGTGDLLRHARSAWDIAGEGPRSQRYPELGEWA